MKEKGREREKGVGREGRRKTEKGLRREGGWLP